MFYATPFKDNLIGPGVAKSEFGGFAVIPLDLIHLNITLDGRKFLKLSNYIFF
jgi:hypothetical protein